MIGRRRNGDPPGLDLPSRAQAAVRGIGEESRPRRGLIGLLARALRGRRPPADAPVTPAEAADAAEVQALRAELTRELDRVATRREEQRPSGSSAFGDAQIDAAG